jgi:hypothetical protein
LTFNTVAEPASNASRVEGSARSDFSYQLLQASDALDGRREARRPIVSAACSNFYESDRLGGLIRVFSSAQLSLCGTTKNGVTCILLNFHSPFCLTYSSL